MTEFNVGDKVEHRTFGRGEIAFGPFDHSSGPDHYLMKQDRDAVHALVVGEAMMPAPTFAVGDTVEYTLGAPVRGKLVAGPFKSEHHDAAIWVVEKANGTHMTPTENALRKVETDTFTYGGVTYDLTSAYRDKDRDTWRFSADPLGGDGTPCGQFRERGDFDDVYTLAYVLREYGPLTKVDD